MYSQDETPDVSGNLTGQFIKQAGGESSQTIPQDITSGGSTDSQGATTSPSKGKGKEEVNLDKSQAIKLVENDATNSEGLVGWLPGVWVREMTGGHDCHCTTCDPTFIEQLEVKLLRRIHRERSTQLSAQTKQRILAKTNAAYHKEQADKLAELRTTAKKEHEKILAAEEEAF